MEIVKESRLPGCLLLKAKVFQDERGTLVKPYHSESFEALGLHCEYREELAVTSRKGVIRGLHFQLPPRPQIKVVSCVYGKILDVVVDIRKGSPTYGEWEGFLLEPSKHFVLYVPEGLAHGYAAYEDNSIVCYRMSNSYTPELDSGIRWDSAGIDWGIEQPAIFPGDNRLPGLNELVSEFAYCI